MTFVELPIASASVAGTEFVCASAVPPQDSATTEITDKYKLRFLFFLFSFHGNCLIGFIFLLLCRRRTPGVSANSHTVNATKSNQPKLTGLDLGRRNCGRSAALRKIFNGRAENGKFNLECRLQSEHCRNGRERQRLPIPPCHARTS